MKKIKALGMDQLTQLFYRNYNVNCIVLDLVGILEDVSKTKLRKYIIDCFERDFTKKELQKITKDIA